MATFHKTRISQFEEVLGEDVIDFKRLRKLAFMGCPHEKSIRSRCWKILLRYMPLKRKELKEHLLKQRQVYANFIDEMIVQPGWKKYDCNRADVTMEDHPLNPNPESQWSQYFRDNEMLLQIDKDCRRLCPDLSFFQSATQFPCHALVSASSGCQNLRKRVEHTVLKAQNVSKNRLGITITDYKRPRNRGHDELQNLSEGQEAHWEVAERILFIYAKLNPGQGYVQGMNEIVGPIYHTFASDPDIEVQEHAECDAFWCFTHLMGEIRDNFIKHLDDSDCGIGMLMRKLVDLLKEKDTALWCKLQQQDLKPQFYAFRWLTLLLSQEFALPDVLRVWDSLLADDLRFEFLISVCCAMLMLIREDVLKGDFSNNMKLIQNYPNIDIHIVLAKAVEVSDRSAAFVASIQPPEVGSPM